jgi:hypothetical protein
MKKEEERRERKRGKRFLYPWAGRRWQQGQQDVVMLSAFFKEQELSDARKRKLY